MAPVRTIVAIASISISMAVFSYFLVFKKNNLILPSNKKKKPRNGVVGAIGNTPLIRINSLSEATGCEVTFISLCFFFFKRFFFFWLILIVIFLFPVLCCLCWLQFRLNSSVCNYLCFSLILISGSSIMSLKSCFFVWIYDLDLHFLSFSILPMFRLQSTVLYDYEIRVLSDFCDWLINVLWTWFPRYSYETFLFSCTYSRKMVTSMF